MKTSPNTTMINIDSDTALGFCVTTEKATKKIVGDPVDFFLFGDKPGVYQVTLDEAKKLDSFYGIYTELGSTTRVNFSKPQKETAGTFNRDDKRAELRMKVYEKLTAKIANKYRVDIPHASFMALRIAGGATILELYTILNCCDIDLICFMKEYCFDDPNYHADPVVFDVGVEG